MNKVDLSRKAHLLHLSSVHLANGMKSGTFKSLYRGQGIEFLGVREYLRGDDVRAIDWNVTARMGKPYVKVFEEERELDVFLIIDCSLSMNTGSGRQSRISVAKECASIITLASLQNSSPVGAVMFDGKIKFSCTPKSGKDHALMLLSQFEKKSESETGSYLGNALKGAEKLLKKKSLVFVISDFRTSGWIESFTHLAQKNDVIALCVTDPSDDILPRVGAVAFSDPETGFECVLPTSSTKFSRTWREYNSMRLEQWKKDCIRHGGIPLEISTTQDPAQELIKFFSSREKLS